MAEPNLKGEVNSFLQRFCKRPITKGDVVYEVATLDDGGFQAMVTLNCLADTPQFAGDLSPSPKDAERSAAGQVLAAYATEVADTASSYKKVDKQTAAAGKGAKATSWAPPVGGKAGAQSMIGGKTGASTSKAPLVSGKVGAKSVIGGKAAEKGGAWGSPASGFAGKATGKAAVSPSFAWKGFGVAAATPWKPPAGPYSAGKPAAKAFGSGAAAPSFAAKASTDKGKNSVGKSLGKGASVGRVLSVGMGASIGRGPSIGIGASIGKGAAVGKALRPDGNALFGFGKAGKLTPGGKARNVAPAVPSNTDPKSLLNKFLQRYCKRPVTKGDCTYAVVQFDQSWQATLTMTCFEEEIQFAGEMCAAPKDAEQAAAAQALAAFAEEVKATEGEYENSKKRKEQEQKALREAEEPDAKRLRVAADVDAPRSDVPRRDGQTFKTLLNGSCLKIVRRPLEKGEISYETIEVEGGFQAKVRVQCLPSGPAEWSGIVCKQAKEAEQYAASEALASIEAESEYAEALASGPKKNAKRRPAVSAAVHGL